MSELRQNLATKEWVIIALERAKRPHEFVDVLRSPCGEGPAWEARCPFCPGNEEEDLDVLRVPAKDPWRVRIVSNRYPALSVKGSWNASMSACSAASAASAITRLSSSRRHNTWPRCKARRTSRWSSAPLSSVPGRCRPTAASSTYSFSRITATTPARRSSIPMRRSWRCLWCRTRCACVPTRRAATSMNWDAVPSARCWGTTAVRGQADPRNEALYRLFPLCVGGAV